MSRLKNKMFKSIKAISAAAALLLVILSAATVMAPPAKAAIPFDCPDGHSGSLPSGNLSAAEVQQRINEACANHQVGDSANDQGNATPSSSSSCATANSGCDCSDKSLKLTTKNCGIVYYLWLFINVLSGLVGVVLVVSIIAAGIQWSTAGDNPQQLSAAKTRIFNTLVAMLLFFFTYALLQWLVPGGVI